MIARRLILGLQHAAELAAEWCGERCRAAGRALYDAIELRWIRIRGSPAADALRAVVARVREAMGWRWILLSSWVGRRADVLVQMVSAAMMPVWRTTRSAAETASSAIASWASRAGDTHAAGPGMSERAASLGHSVWHWLRAAPARAADRALKNRSAAARAAFAAVFAAVCIAVAAFFVMRNPAPKLDERHTQASAWIQQLAGSR